MKILIIDDEKKARILLESILKETCKEVTTIFQASDLEIGVDIIRKEIIDIVFLDVEMPRYSGVEILDFFKNEKITFQLIMTTAYEEYALKAFKLSAIDFLLKPIDIKELKQAVEKAINIINSQRVEYKIDSLKTSFHQLTKSTIALEVPRGIIFVSYEDILFFEADRMYSKVYMKDGRVEMISKPLKYFIEQLEDNLYFFRNHRSYLINLKHVKKFVKEDGGYLMMLNNKTLPLSKEKKNSFLNVIQIVF